MPSNIDLNTYHNSFGWAGYKESYGVTAPKNKDNIKLFYTKNTVYRKNS